MGVSLGWPASASQTEMKCGDPTASQLVAHRRVDATAAAERALGAGESENMRSATASGSIEHRTADAASLRRGARVASSRPSSHSNNAALKNGDGDVTSSEPSARPARARSLSHAKGHLVEWRMLLNARLKLTDSLIRFLHFKMPSAKLNA